MNFKSFVLSEAEKISDDMNKPLSKILNNLKRKEKEMITERTLKKWRSEALKGSKALNDIGRTEDGTYRFSIGDVRDLQDRIIRMTQELLDQHLLRK